MIRRRILLALLIWAGFGLLLLIGGRAHAEQPFRIVVTLTSEDVQALVAWKGWQGYRKLCPRCWGDDASNRGDQAMPEVRALADRFRTLSLQAGCQRLTTDQDFDGHLTDHAKASS